LQRKYANRKPKKNIQLVFYLRIFFANPAKKNFVFVKKTEARERLVAQRLSSSARDAMARPVVDVDGRTYDESAVRAWAAAGRDTCMRTNARCDKSSRMRAYGRAAADMA
jgi:hypothetical protein